MIDKIPDESERLRVVISQATKRVNKAMESRTIPEKYSAILEEAMDFAQRFAEQGSKQPEVAGSTLSKAAGGLHADPDNSLDPGLFALLMAGADLARATEAAWNHVSSVRANIASDHVRDVERWAGELDKQMDEFDGHLHGR